MRLVSFGDSFVEGLIKDPKPNSIEERDEICFTRKITEGSDIFDSYLNYGERGSGNVAICHNVYKHVSRGDLQDNDFLLICWSGLGRASTYNRLKEKYEISDIIITEFEPIFQINMLASGIHNYLKSKNIPHIFTSSFTPFYMFQDFDAISSEYIIGDTNTSNSLFDIISRRFNKKHVKHFGSYLTSHCVFKVKKTKYIAKCLHPTAKGHKLIASTLTPYIEKMLKENL